MSQLQRARSPEAKEARRTAILTAARALFERQPYESITMAAVARRARLAKGTVFLYFPTRETLFFELFDQLLDEWLGVLHEAVALDTVPWGSARLAGLIAGTLSVRPLLVRLFALSDAVLEPGVAADRVAAFRHRLLRRQFGLGSLIEQRLGLARRGDGVQLLTFAGAMIVGLRRRTPPPGDRRETPAGPAPETAEPVLDTDLRTALTVPFNGFHRKAG